jgi:hypothetical protein
MAMTLLDFSNDSVRGFLLQKFDVRTGLIAGESATS